MGVFSNKPILQSTIPSVVSFATATITSSLVLLAAIAGHLLPATNNAYDLGSSTSTYRNGYFGTLLSAPTVTTTQITLNSGQTIPYYRPDNSAFTASNGVGTANASTLTITIPASTVATAFADVPRLTIPHNGDAMNLEVIARLAAASGGNGNTYYRIWVASPAGDGFILVQANGTGGAATVYGTGGLVALGETLPLDGTGWVRIAIRDGRLSVMLGVTNGNTVDWRTWYRDNPVFPTSPGSSAYSLVKLDMYQGSGAAGTVTSTWSNVQIRNLF